MFLHIITTIVVKSIKPGNWWWKQRSVQQWWDQLQSGDQLQSQIARGICPNKYFWLIQWIENPFNKNLWSKTAPQYWWCRKVSILPGTWSPVHCLDETKWAKAIASLTHWPVIYWHYLTKIIKFGLKVKVELIESESIIYYTFTFYDVCISFYW